METKGPKPRLHTIAALTLETINRLSQAETPLDVETLAASLSASSELKALAGPASTAENFLKGEVLRLKKDLAALQGQYGKVDAKRRELSDQLDAAEAALTRHRTFLQRTVPALVQQARSGDNPQVHEHLDRVTQLLKEEAPLDQLETEFQQFKTSAFKVELKKRDRKEPPPRSSTLLNLFKRPAKPGQVVPVSYFRDTYMEIVEELRLNLDQAALRELAEIKSLLSGVEQVEALPPIRQKLLLLLKKYISRISAERKQAATFILEVGERLHEIEQQMLRSIEVVRESRDATTLLTTSIEKEMDAFQETVDFTTSLEELKTAIMDRISAIKKVIESSREEDRSRSTRVDGEVAALNRNLDRMKLEIKSAKERSESLEAELLTDPLTQAFNRRAYDQRIVDELERFHRYHTIFSMLLLDVDHFKEINDRYGHSVGDLCLREIINRIKPLLRKPDFLSRFGGEEFIIILPETGRDGARQVAEKIRMHIEKTEFLHKGENVKVTISLGGTQVQVSDRTGDGIFERVDEAMYRAKQSGRNQVVMI